jgi:hypothetical protein
MSRKAPLGLTVLEKIIGLLMIVIGALTSYATFNDVANIGTNLGLFLASGMGLIVVGIFLFVAKAE